jgi:hypothetical protein
MMGWLAFAAVTTSFIVYAKLRNDMHRGIVDLEKLMQVRSLFWGGFALGTVTIIASCSKNIVGLLI